MRISVVMATWQGERYLSGQLASFVGQARRPDELIVVDDASDDGTVDLIEAFARDAPFKVHLLRSEFRQGSTAAFERGISEASGDLIALSDQDDLWMPQKLARLETIFREHPETTFAFTDAQLIADGDVTRARTMWEVRRFTPALQAKVRRRPFAELAHRWLATGCTIAFRSDLRELLLPFPTDLTDLYPPMIHDRWLSLVLSGAGPVAVVSEPLVAYRLHPAQQIGLTNVATVQPAVSRHLRKVVMHRPEAQALREYQLAHLCEVRDRLRKCPLAGESRLLEVEGAVSHLRLRIELPTSRLARLRPIGREAALGRYHRFSRGWRSVAVDLLKP
jgi:glycosyltransferase involved in cell wall biosynthesis